MTVKRIFGSGPNQIARNKDLGSLAWQNKTGLNLQNTGATYIVGGSPALPNAAQINFVDAGSSNGYLTFSTTASGTVTERMRLDTSGNLGLGVTPSVWQSSWKALQVGSRSFLAQGSSSDFVAGYNWYQNSGGTNTYIASTGANAYLMDGAHKWLIAPSGTAGTTVSFTQAMTLDASGNLLVAKTTAGQVLTKGAELSSNGGVSATTDVANTSSYFVNIASSGTRYLQRFYAGSTLVGSITSDGTNTTYGTTSDYRLKENIQPMQNALGVVAQLNPVTYTWKADGSDGQGFIAHELQAVVPDCVTGEKDAVDAEGKPVYQGIDTSFLVATLTKAIQELKAELDELKAKVN